MFQPPRPPTSGPAGPVQFARRQPQSLPQPQPERHYFNHNPTKVEAFRQGYPRFAAFINCDRDFVAFRGFGRLHARILLFKQDEIIELEQKLQNLDDIEANAYHLTSRRDDQASQRSQMLSDIEKKLVDYDQFLNLYYGNIERQASKTANVRSLSRWLDGNKPLALQESTFLDDWDDLISPRNIGDRGGFDFLIEKLATALDKIGLGKLLTAKDKSDDNHVVLFTTPRVVAVTQVLTTFLAVIILTGPVIALYRVKKMSIRLSIITICTGLFASVVRSFPQSRTIEVFSATAAYCAVMVVFVGSLPN